MVAKITTLPRTLLVVGALAMSPAFAFAQSAPANVSAAPAATIKQDATAATKAPEAKNEAKAEVKTDKKQSGAKAVKTSMRAAAKPDAKVDTKAPAAPAASAPAVQPKS